MTYFAKGPSFSVDLNKKTLERQLNDKSNKYCAR